MKVNPGTRRAH